LYNTKVITLSIYRLTLHPLTKYPGPFWAKITDWVIVFQTATGDRHLDQLKDHERYGSIVRIGPNTLSFNTLAATKEIYANRKANVQKSQWYAIIEASTQDYSTHGEIDRKVHAFRRRVLDQAFSEKALKSAETFIVQNVKSLRDVIARSPRKTATSGDEKDADWSEPFNMSQWSTYLNYDIMGDLVFGRRFNCMTSDAHRFVPRLLMNGSAFVYSVSLITLFSLLGRVRCVVDQ
jgi:cytochrome P450